MAKKVKLALVSNENARAISLKKRRSGLVKKVKELSILCDVKACLIMFSPKEVEPMVWPSVEAASSILKDFNALPEFMKKKNETTLESYLKEKALKVHENLRKTQKENMEYVVDKLMVELSCFRKLDDLDVNEVYSLISFSKDAIMRLRKKVDSVQHAPLRNPPVYPFEEQVKEFKTTKDDVKMVSIGTFKENQSYYLMDEWIFPDLNPHFPQTHQQIMMNMASCIKTSYQGSSSNGDHNLEMEPIFPPTLAFPGFVGPVSHPFQHHHSMNNIPTMAMNAPKQYPFDIMSHEEGSSTYKSSNIDDHQEPPPATSGATAEDMIMD